MPLLYHAYVYLEFLILACTIYILAPNVTEINSSSLIGCNNLQAVSIGDGITELGNLFSGGGGLNRLTSISIGKGLNSVDDGGSTNTFRNLKALEQINVCPENEAFVSGWCFV